jgi:hypothetical protein
MSDYHLQKKGAVPWSQSDGSNLVKSLDSVPLVRLQKFALIKPIFKLYAKQIVQQCKSQQRHEARWSCFTVKRPRELWPDTSQFGYMVVNPSDYNTMALIVKLHIVQIIMDYQPVPGHWGGLEASCRYVQSSGCIQIRLFGIWRGWGKWYELWY